MRRLPHPRFLLFLAVFLCTAMLLSLRLDPAKAVVLGFDAGALAFVLSTLPLLRESDPHANRARAQRDDGGRGALLMVTLGTLVIVAMSLGQVIVNTNTPSTFGVLTELGTVLLAWLFVNLVYAFHYAHLFYDQVSGPIAEAADKRGLDFPGTDTPVFSDFCYFSFVIGMTSQVSDVTISSPSLRRTALVQGLIFYVFNFGVIALTINMLASLF
ncbi:MAG: DUF1345 domain-containing protein [Paracoccaceae bacterium]